MKTLSLNRIARGLALSALLFLTACSIRPYAGMGVGIGGPSWNYGPFRVGTGANIGIALPVR